MTTIENGICRLLLKFFIFSLKISCLKRKRNGASSILTSKIPQLFQRSKKEKRALTLPVPTSWCADKESLAILKSIRKSTFVHCFDVIGNGKMEIQKKR